VTNERLFGDLIRLAALPAGAGDAAARVVLRTVFVLFAELTASVRVAILVGAYRVVDALVGAARVVAGFANVRTATRDGECTRECDERMEAPRCAHSALRVTLGSHDRDYRALQGNPPSEEPDVEELDATDAPVAAAKLDGSS
jgi:hypothetical protein